MKICALCIAAALLLSSCARFRPNKNENAGTASHWTNSLGMVFVSVPHTSVRFSIYETRVRDFAAFAATHPKLDGTEWNHALYHGRTPVSDGPDFPVVNVSWNDATAFCEWLTEKERRSGTISSAESYRLPTDAEWSWAAGIGDRETGTTPKEKNAKLENVYPWGTQFPPPAGAGNFADHAALNYFTNWPNIAGYNDGYVTTSPAGRFRPNAFGIYDLAGNADEWCQDSYDGSPSRRELRGGAWVNTGTKSLWSSRRMAVSANRFSVITGFRCVLTGANGGGE
ncbi:MAG TPA: SUMF1/EgtB/PvdO family nonheme iron enzyme [Verrucomicrobiae bacterium]|nr:SUMF1/EgtB/PvdO family nonheme iron enzyme [Verrucomicrobiae bacterium]